jgi:hypothetical protein
MDRDIGNLLLYMFSREALIQKKKKEKITLEIL